MAWIPGHSCLLLLSLHIICSSLIPVRAEEESRECREQEYKDQLGNCKPCKQCDAGQELSKECGFGYGEDARCVPCRSSRFKEDRSLQKCKPCLDCGLINRFQKGNCSTTSNAVCGDCLPGFYRKTKLSGFQDMECIPCGDPPPPYEPHCSGRVNLVPIPSVVTSPRDMALAAVICSALATVMLALLILCVIYCKRQLLEKKPSASLRPQEGPYSGAELSCLDRRRLHELQQRPCCQCHLAPGHACGPVHLIPSLCCDESCDRGQSQGTSPFPSQDSLHLGHLHPMEEPAPACPGERPDSLSGETDQTRLLPQNPDKVDDGFGHQEPTRKAKAEGEEVRGEDDEGCRWREEAQEDSVEQGSECYEDAWALTEVLLPKQQPSSLEG
ncbi:tumor necrosis factor receptor superfamily member 19-like [Hypomesus transpacificus]|uniref:tumor necrosis factor receptor superfamily member 19-like n=1 Tax=Hypomesus transpacificus TaxID=137520 RepID=UPI001F0885B5|nr:tumor necrosis factor receptor superfamily member 19-like [Hypomesus transpacificus]XP_046891398.1 tumor necrosis factor receptor superfamily member 19-like [Hypomesus transpacificus]